MSRFRLLLFPISILVWIYSNIRNLFYDLNILKSYQLSEKSICVGNLSLGGTGKTPLVRFLAEQFCNKQKVVILSRGYGRKTKGFKEVETNMNFLETGDEPLMYKKKFQDHVGVYVCESRVLGVQEIRKKKKFDLLILDDAFQHRKIKTGFSILLTEYQKPFFQDFIFPAGNLREPGKGKNRADLLLVTKCPENLDTFQKNEFIRKSGLKTENVFFSKIHYDNLVSFSPIKTKEIENILLVTGIANPSPLQDFLKKNYKIEMIQFPDHHQFSVNDILKIHKKFDTFARDKKAIVTTEKDFVRLTSPQFSALIYEKPWYYQEISIKIDREKEFLEKINTYVRKI